MYLKITERQDFSGSNESDGVNITFEPKGANNIGCCRLCSPVLYFFLGIEKFSSW